MHTHYTCVCVCVPHWSARLHLRLRMDDPLLGCLSPRKEHLSLGRIWCSRAPGVLEGLDIALLLIQTENPLADSHAYWIWIAPNTWIQSGKNTCRFCKWIEVYPEIQRNFQTGVCKDILIMFYTAHSGLIDVFTSPIFLCDSVWKQRTLLVVYFFSSKS